MFESEQQRVLFEEAKRKAGRLVSEYRDAGGGIPWARWQDCFRDFGKDAQQKALKAAKEMNLLEGPVVWFADVPKATSLDIKQLFAKFATQLGVGSNQRDEVLSNEQHARQVKPDAQVRAKKLQDELVSRKEYAPAQRELLNDIKKAADVQGIIRALEKAQAAGVDIFPSSSRPKITDVIRNVNNLIYYLNRDFTQTAYDGNETDMLMSHIPTPIRNRLQVNEARNPNGKIIRTLIVK